MLPKLNIIPKLLFCVFWPFRAEVIWTMKRKNLHMTIRTSRL